MLARKKVTTEIKKFIENLVLKYGIEDDFINRDPVLKQNLELVSDPEERLFIKALYSQEIKDCLNTNRPLEEVLASVTIKKLIEKFINKEIGLGDIEKSLEQKLNLSANTAKEIAKSIIENQQVIKEYEAEFVSEEDEETREETPIIRKNIAPKGLNQELL
ncbi:MAG: hypothetical protein PHO90_00815 [Candidatus Pacebacteria bacterium]|jgi:uncharacterized protein YheU (UPF0270 family)|nr:hypothetical protein [Candidatus Paceibacterota bacterium]